MGKKVRVKCNDDVTIRDLKKLVAAQTDTLADKIRIQKWYNIYKDHITLRDYEIHDGVGLELYQLISPNVEDIVRAAKRVCYRSHQSGKTELAETLKFWYLGFDHSFESFCLGAKWVRENISFVEKYFYSLWWGLQNLGVLHPVLMLIGLIILGGEAIITYKSLPLKKPFLIIRTQPKIIVSIKWNIAEAQPKRGCKNCPLRWQDKQLMVFNMKEPYSIK
ncbi:hypothetical protein CASFOL_031924 [Castilleja foliolosa]|uniref:Cytochrome b561 domain-containing protein n=1 Tax=Castilleja foliolosa TaxID=1961234 RepID=A0ABD3C006_9LAMI